MKKVLMILGVFVFLSAGGAWALRSSARSNAVPPLRILLTDAQGTVERQDQDSATWSAVQIGAVLMPGQHVRTGIQSSAVITFYGRSTARLDASSEIEISDDTGVSTKNEQIQRVRLQAVSGRVWSRILKLLDKDSSYEVYHGTTVATVRGTAFNFVVKPEGAVTVDVTDHEVLVARGTVSGMAAAGQTVDMPPENASMPEFSAMVTSTSAEHTDDSWFSSNTQADVEFDQEASDDWEARQAQHDALPHEFFGLMSIGQSLDRMISGDPQDLPPRLDPRTPQPESEPAQDLPPPPPPNETDQPGGLELLGVPSDTPVPPNDEPNHNPAPEPTPSQPTDSPKPAPKPQPAPTPTPEPQPATAPVTETAPEPVVLKAIQVISVPNDGTSNTVQFQATAHYSDNSTKNITTLSRWAVTTPGAGSIAQSGLLTLSDSAQDVIHVSATFENLTGDGSIAVLVAPGQ